MTANAPYYQMRSGQFITTPNRTNAASPQFVPDEDEYDLSGPAAAVASPLEQHHLNPHMYSEDAARQASTHTTLEENHNLAELLEAATAAGQAVQAMDIDDAVVASTAPQGSNKRKRISSLPAAEASAQTAEAIRGKRQRIGGPTDPHLQHGDRDRDVRGTSADGSALPSTESLLNDARAAGVHSAAALFRRTSERTSRKYTRPPMSKLFMSLQLSPEGFLQLQASAKAYMLDSLHPERQSCVGNRGKGDTDMVKLRLFNCVRDFLNDGIGERFFGEHVEKPGEKDAIEAARALGEEKAADAGERLTWPRDGNKIISLVTPLMRRMVTNERQRQYAIETRKGGAKKKDKESSVEATIEHTNSHVGYEGPSLQAVFDPGLGRSVQRSQPTSPLTPIATSPAHTALRYHEGYAEPRGTLEGGKDNPSASSNLDYSVPSSSEPNLSQINIFLVLASSGSKSGTKLDERRIAAEPRAHLAWYDYTDFMKEVHNLLKKAAIKYPNIVAKCVPRESGSGTENLQGLAAAANALQSEGSRQEPGTSDDPSAIVLADVSVATGSPNETMAANDHGIIQAERNAKLELLPHYIVKSLGAEGWRGIRNADDWYSVLRERAFAVWADGVCNVLVELVDV
ncbi:hypothetical protein BDW02DRAFT_331240 [Decorospora gaudefroyi]|uniref:Uncharacterized protein n=1 Tax=Decorospora gaudefroyi TaxID=184978 RepID=A0A6A5K9F5_9PLEO|nr:hypothetical protein BDW02DRAFT_331240 [Decorospora gaudefroyi]